MDMNIIFLINQLDRIIKDNEEFYTDYLLVIKEMLKAYNKEYYMKDFKEEMKITLHNILEEIEERSYN